MWLLSNMQYPFALVQIIKIVSTFWMSSTFLTTQIYTQQIKTIHFLHKNVKTGRIRVKTGRIRVKTGRTFFGV
jgi:hypothetical protein